MVWNRVNPVQTEVKVTKMSWTEPIQEEMAVVEERLHEIPVGQHKSLTTAMDLLLNAGGKRIRPALCLLTAGVYNADFGRAISLAAAVELLHTATLVHDDIIDGALIRRGVPTLNAEWRSDTAVLAGDYMFARAANLVVYTNDIRIMDLLAKTLLVILNGEITQRFSRWQIDRQEYYERIYAKTAAMFVLSMEAAGMLGGADQTDLEALREYGHSVGLAFQIVDDVLDFTSSMDQLGKPVGSDLRQGLITLPVIHFAETYPDDEDLTFLLDTQDGDHSAVSRLISSVRKSEAIEESLREARQLVERGQRALRVLPVSIYTEALGELASTAVNREM